MAKSLILLYNPTVMTISLEYLVGGLLFVVVILAIWNILLDRRVSKMLRGGKTQSLEETIRSLERETKSLTAFRSEMEKYLATVEKRLHRSVQGVSTVRFQAFRGIGDGGNQSFASAFVSEKGNGVVISSIYSRDLVGIYAKPIENGNARFELTQEEKEAVTKARETANA